MIKLMVNSVSVGEGLGNIRLLVDESPAQPPPPLRSNQGQAAVEQKQTCTATLLLTCQVNSAMP